MLATRGIPDPFEMRSFATPPGSPFEGQGHHVEQAKTALVQVAVPAMRLSSPEIEKLSLQFYKIKAGPPVFHVDPELFQKTKAGGAVGITEPCSCCDAEPPDSTQSDQERITAVA
jgi:hypothetical protein